MQTNNSTGSLAASAWGFMALFAMLAMGLGLMAQPAAAAPFAYVANFSANTVSVIDTATNPPSVVATVQVGSEPVGVAITPDGKHAYVTNNGSSTVSVIATATNTVVGTPIPVGSFPVGVAVAPDGKHGYVTTTAGVSVIDTATNAVVATVPLGGLSPLRSRSRRTGNTPTSGIVALLLSAFNSAKPFTSTVSA